MRNEDNRPLNHWFHDNKRSKGSRQFQYNSKGREESTSQDVRQSQYENGESSGLSVPNCYIYRKDGHYVNQCPTKEKGKALVENMVIAEVQQVTTRSKAKQFEWDIYEVVCKAAKEWIEEANNNNVT